MSNRSMRSWVLLFALTGAGSYAMRLIQFPAYALLGGMIAAILVAIYVQPLRMPAPLFQFGQGIIGLMIGLNMPKGFLAELQRSWPLFVAGVAWAVVASTLLGWFLTKRGFFPGTTAIWGLSPGAATSMIIMSEDFGGDMRIVAFMQYFRNVGVIVLTSIVARIWGASTTASTAGGGLFVAPEEWSGFGLTLLAVAGILSVARWTRIPAGAILLPLIGGIVFNYTGVLSLETPPWLLPAGSVLIGWSIGLRFNRPVLRQIAHSVPVVAAAVLTLLAVCGLFSLFMWREMGIDPLTAYLAACPGGLDSVAIIAATAQVDISFVLAMHTARFLIVVLTGPFLARQIVKRVGGKI